MLALSRRTALIALVFGLAQTSIANDLPEIAPAPRLRTPAPLATATLKGLELRPLGPCITPGRIGDIAVDPKNRSVWYVAMASGRRVEDDQSRRHLEVDLRQPRLVLDRLRHDRPEELGRRLARHRREPVAAQRRLRRRRLQEHRRRRAPGRTSASRTPSTSRRSSIDPRDSNVVYVASQGPLWSQGGDRGLYKTTDGGKTWKAVLDDRREHRRHRCLLRPARPGRALRRVVPAAPQRRRA